MGDRPGVTGFVWRPQAGRPGTRRRAPYYGRHGPLSGASISGIFQQTDIQPCELILKIRIQLSSLVPEPFLLNVTHYRRFNPVGKWPQGGLEQVWLMTCSASSTPPAGPSRSITWPSRALPHDRHMARQHAQTQRRISRLHSPSTTIINTYKRHGTPSSQLPVLKQIRSQPDAQKTHETQALSHSCTLANQGNPAKDKREAIPAPQPVRLRREGGGHRQKTDPHSMA